MWGGRGRLAAIGTVSVERGVHFCKPLERLEELGGQDAERMIRFGAEEQDGNLLRPRCYEFAMYVGHYRRCSFRETSMCEVGIALEIKVDHQGIYASERQKGCRGQEDVVAVFEGYR